jgi:predicted DCC family thiol-disulfide oxidoreductase YuxK
VQPHGAIYFENETGIENSFIIHCNQKKGMNILKDLKFDLKNYDSFVYVRYGKVFIKSTAGLKILLDLGGGWKLLYGLIIFPRFIRDFVYDVIAKYRYRIWGKKDGNNYC